MIFIIVASEKTCIEDFGGGDGMLPRFTHLYVYEGADRCLPDVVLSTGAGGLCATLYLPRPPSPLRSRLTHTYPKAPTARPKGLDVFLGFPTTKSLSLNAGMPHRVHVVGSPVCNPWIFKENHGPNIHRGDIYPYRVGVPENEDTCFLRKALGGVSVSARDQETNL